MRCMDMAWKWLNIMFGLTMAGFLVLVTTTTLFTCVLTGRASVTPPTVVTPFGTFRGIERTLYDNSTVNRFAGIPFAQPPVGKGRFLPPEPIRHVKPSSKIIDAQKFKKSCLTLTKKAPNPYYGEDCLYLNVYVPASNGNTYRPAVYPVMVWIHGGGFVAGSVFPEPWQLVARGDVIVVSVNYRMGVFGFLTTGDTALPANNGLWDQVMAMKWVRENIEYFGGDADSITVFGESAGAVSVGIHVVSPVSSPLFDKAILQSGAAFSLLSRNPTEIAQEFGQNVGCHLRSDTQEFASCLRNVSVEDILAQSWSISMSAAQRQVDFIWIPTVDGVLIPKEPMSLLTNKTYLASIGAFSKDYLLGCNNNEGGLLVENFMSPISAQTVEDINFFQNLTDFVLSMTYNIAQNQCSQCVDSVMSFYTGSPIPESPRAQSVMDFLADAMFYGPEVLMATSLSGCYKNLSPDCNARNVTPSVWDPDCQNATGRTFLYYFDYCPPEEDASCKQKCMVHGKDVWYEFPKTPFDDDTQQQVSESFIDFLTTFAKTSQPGTALKSGFPVFEDKFQNYLRFSAHPRVDQHLHLNRMNFWTKTIPRLIEEKSYFL